MSTDSGTPSLSSETGFSFREALIVIGIVIGFLILLLVLRFGCNLFIDLCILCDCYEARRTCIECQHRFFPCFRRRLVVPERRRARGVIEGEDGGRSPEDEEVTMESLLRSLTDHEKTEILASMLEERLVGRKDMKKWKGKYDIEAVKGSSPDKAADAVKGVEVYDDDHFNCSICLLAIEVGNAAFVSPPCQHVFHHSCIVEWCKGNNTACPYCRTPMITGEQIRAAVVYKEERFEGSSSEFEQA